ncbi:MAG TPA: MFS transporter [Myxococcota bacterium]
MPTLRESLRGFRFAVERDWQFVLATFAASGIGYLGSAAAPFIVQALIEFGLSHREAGDLGTIELTTLALASMIMTPLVPYVSHRKLAIAGVSTAVLGLAISALAVDYFPMLLGRLIIGTGSGLAISGANAAIAAREEAERIFAIIWTMGGAITGALAINMPRLVADGNYSVGFVVLIALSLCAAPFMFWLPPRPVAFAEGLDTGPQITSGEVHAGRFGPFGVSAVLVLAAMFIYAISEQALWQFCYELALDAGMAVDAVSWIMGFTVFMGLAGGAIAAWLGLRMGRVFPLVLGSLLSLVGRWAWIAAPDTGTLWVAGVFWGLGYYFVLPYQMGLAAGIDRRGRVAVAAGGLSNLGYGLGPGLGGRIRQYQVDNDLDHTMLIVVIAGMTVLSMVLLLPVAARMDRRSRAAAARSDAGSAEASAAEFTEEPWGR